jgi:emp24/gp25L/p24 family/GOLD
MILFILINYAYAFKFYLPAQKDLSSQTLSVLEFSSKSDLGLKIIDPEDFELYSSSSTNHKYSFTALNSGIYKYCLDNKHNTIVLIDISIKIGVKARDYSNIASTKNLKSIELKLKKLDDQTRDIHKKIQILREREEEMRNTNQTIHNRVIGYSISTIMLLLAIALIQILYLKRHFRAKKMI